MFALVVGLIGRSGSTGVFVLMLIENLVPIIPSELILPLAGFEAAEGRLHPASALLAATAGSVVGALAWYALGLRLGEDRVEAWAARYGRWVTVTPLEVRRSTVWLRRHGVLAVALGRCIPGVRGLVSIPAGVVGMRLLPFLVSCTAGSLCWSALLIGAGYLLKRDYAAVEHWVGPASTAVLALCTVLYIGRLFRRG